MLIDTAPEPGPIPRFARTAGPTSHATPGEPSESFGVVFARDDAKVLAAPSPVPDPEVPPADPTTDGRETGETVEGDENPHNIATEGENSPMAPRLGERHADAPSTTAQTQSQGVAGARPEATGRPSAPDAGVPDPAPARVAPTSVSGDRTAADAAPAALPKAAEGAALADGPREPGSAQPSSAPSSADAKAQVFSAVEAKDVSANHPGREVAQRTERAAPDPAAANPARQASEGTLPPPPIVDSVLKARLNAARLSHVQVSEAVAARAGEGAMLGFGSALAEQGALPASTETAAARLLPSASAVNVEVARDIAQQIAARIMPLARGQFELTLAPAELGRLDITLREVDGLMTLSVNAERPETLEMIRRHVELLAQELRQIAQRELSLQVGTGGSGGNAGGREPAPGGSTARATGEPAHSDAGAMELAPMLGLDHLDLRL